MNTEAIIEMIVNKYDDYTPEKIDAIKDNLENMSPFLKLSLERTLLQKDTPEVNLNGYTVAMLVSDHGMNEVAAHLTLDWILREPQEAIRSLQKGHDTVRI